MTLFTKTFNSYFFFFSALRGVDPNGPEAVLILATKILINSSVSFKISFR
jgi:hypothetical protein